MLQRLSNPAADIGPQQVSWWQDWRGEAVAIVACGPSAGNAGVEALRGRIKVLAIKEAFTRLVPFADVVYGCEAPWWKHVRGLPDFKGLKLAWDGAQFEFPGIHKVHLESKHIDRILVTKPGVIGAGAHSGFQALNIAVQFGARRILLIGFDIRSDGGVHFYGRNTWPKANNPDDVMWKRAAKAMNACGETLRSLGVDVINASPVSAVTVFRKMSVGEALAEWGL